MTRDHMADAARYALAKLPHVPPATSLRWIGDRPRESPVPSSDRRVFVASWFCIPGGNWFGDARIVAPYCGAPDGYRCSCGAQLAGHDFGDEDPVRP